MKPVVPFSDKDAFIESNLRLVTFIIKRYTRKAQSRGIDYEDLYGAGCIGLMKAYNAFDPDRGLKFSTYAVPKIYGEVQAYIRDAGETMSVPRSEYELSNRIRWNKLEDKPVTLIAAELSCTTKLVERTLESMNLKVRSLNYAIRQHDSSQKIETIADSVPVHDDLTHLYVDEFLRSLEGRVRVVAELRLLERTQTEIGQATGVSQAQICRDLLFIGKQLAGVM